MNNRDIPQQKTNIIYLRINNVYNKLQTKKPQGLYPAVLNL